MRPSAKNRVGNWYPVTHRSKAMPEHPRNAALVVELAQAFAREMPAIAPDWQRAYLRIAVGQQGSAAKASFVSQGGVGIVDVIAHKPFFHWVTSIARELCNSLPLSKPPKVALMILNEDLSYEVKYEYDNERRWTISKLNGASGIPEEH